MKVKRDNLGHICQINMDDGSEIPSDEIKTAFDFISDDEEKITERYKIDTVRQKNRCDMWRGAIPGVANAIPDILDAITRNIITQQNQPVKNVDGYNMQQEFVMPTEDEQ